MTRRYETVYIFDSALEEAQVNERLEKAHALLAVNGKPAVTAVSHWGKRTLAYSLKKHSVGYYVVVQFETAADKLPEYERALKLDESLLRFLVVLDEGQAPAPVAAPAVAAPEAELEDEEDQ
jgi:small subunit ribosomal protein S6